MHSSNSRRFFLILFACVPVVAVAEQAPQRSSIDPPHIAADKSVRYDYDIVYVRAPRFGDDRITRWTEAERPTVIDPGADLVLLRPDGSEEVLVEGGKGSVADPAVSFDGQWVYYAHFHDLTDVGSLQHYELPAAGSEIYRVHVKTKEIVRLTEQRFTPNTGAADWSRDFRTPEDGKHHLPYGVFNLSPCPVPGGKVVFTSNRNGFRPPRTAGVSSQPTLQLFVMDDDLSENAEIPPGSNVEQIGHLNIGTALHPVALKDGRVMFASLESQGIRTPNEWGLWSIHPDGTNWGPLVSGVYGPGAGNLIHFQTQLSDESLVWEWYYSKPPANSGMGTYLKQPIAPPEGQPAFGPGDINHPLNQYPPGWGNQGRLPLRFAPYGVHALTPFTTGRDVPAPPLDRKDPDSPRLGKFTHPSGAPDNHLLTCYSPGAVHGTRHGAAVDGGIYLIKEGRPIESPGEMLLIKNDPRYNEQWPRAVVPYERIYGVKQPRQLQPLANDGTLSPHLPEGTPFGLVGTSSLYKRESYPNGAVAEGGGTAVYSDVTPHHPDPWKHLGYNRLNWREQGSDAGIYENSDIHAIRILIQEPTTDRRTRRFYSHATERLRILGEIPVRKFDKIAAGEKTVDGQPVDPDGNPDTSFLAKIPADQSFTFQTLDKKGMLLNMAQTWHQVRPGEVRHDCGGCHAHSQAPTPFELTAAARPDYHVFDLTEKTSLLTTKDKDESNRKWDASDSTGLRFAEDALNVEYFRDVQPILQKSCVACHTKNWKEPAGNLVLDDDDNRIKSPATAEINRAGGAPGTYFRLALDDGVGGGGQKRIFFGHRPVGDTKWSYPMASRYVWMFQARRSLLIWKIFGERLDGFHNADHPSEPEPGAGYLVHNGKRIDDPKRIWKTHPPDIDFTGSVMPPPEAVAGTYRGPDGQPIKVEPLTDEDRLTLVRWIDLGCPIDFDYDPDHPESRGSGWMCDDQRPTLTLADPKPGPNPSLSRILIGLADAYTGIDSESLRVTADFDIDGIPAGTDLAKNFTRTNAGIWQWRLKKPIQTLPEGKLTIQVKDRQGNLSRIKRVFSVQPPASR